MSTKKRAAKKVPINYQNGKIYKIVNDVNDIIYIGSTTTPLPKRFSDHKSGSKTRPGKFYEAVRAIGFENFKILLVELYPCTCKAELEAREYSVAAEYTKEKLYNSILDGKHSDESRAKIKANHQGAGKFGENHHNWKRGSIGEYFHGGRNTFKFCWMENGEKKSKTFAYGKTRSRDEAHQACVDLQNTVFPLPKHDDVQEMPPCE